MQWFKHDTDANQDAKLQNVLLDYGLEGYGLYWYCIELIASKVDKDNITFELEHDARIIARNTGSTQQKVEEMMRRFVELGLFENSHGTITCLKLAKRLDKSMTSNPIMRGIIHELRNGCLVIEQNHDPVMTPSEKIMQDKIRLDKNKDLSSQQADTTFDFEQVKQAYNEFANSNGLATIRAVTDKKKREVRSAYKVYCKIRKATGKDPVSGNEFVAGYLAIVQSLMTEFHTGQNKNNWKAGFDYFFATDIVENVLNENKLSRK